MNQGRDSLDSYLRDHRAWSQKTFGDGLKTDGITAHIVKELAEIKKAPLDLMEWIDVLILGMDGFWRAGGKSEDLLAMLRDKQRINMAREWPPAVDGQPTEHKR